MIICLCHRISERDIRRAAEAGLRSFEELRDETCIARNCACCEDCARELFDDARRACAVATPVRLVRGPSPRGHHYAEARTAANASG